MAETITVCDDLIDKVFSPNMDNAIFALTQAKGVVCGLSVCGGGKRPRLTFQTEEGRGTFVAAARALSRDAGLGAWLQETNPRLAVGKRGKPVTVASIDYR